MLRRTVVFVRIVHLFTWYKYPYSIDYRSNKQELRCPRKPRHSLGVDIEARAGSFQRPPACLMYDVGLYPVFVLTQTMSCSRLGGRFNEGGGL